jgi:hypothetical protein
MSSKTQFRLVLTSPQKEPEDEHLSPGPYATWLKIAGADVKDAQAK